MVYRNHMIRTNELEGKRILFVKEILQFIIKDEPYGYFDEMAMHSFLTIKKAWSYEDTPVETPVNSGNRLKLSVYGTISNILPKPHFGYGYKPTNGEDALAYFKILKEEVEKYTDKKMHLILDNHAAHKSRLYGTKQYLEENFHIHWMVPGTPQLNSIETFWSVFKRRFKKLLMLNPLLHWTQS